MFPNTSTFPSTFRDDPFFSQMQRDMDHMFNASFRSDPFSHASLRRAAPAQPRHSVTVEEVDDNEEFTTHASRPTVEEPDEGISGQPAAHQRQSQSRHSESRPVFTQQPVYEQPYQERPAYARPARRQDQQLTAARSGSSQHTQSNGRPGMITYSSSSSFVSYGGPGGVSVQRTQSARTGPGGVAEYSESYMDGRCGEGTSQHSRFIGDRGRTAQRSWSANRQGSTQDILHNLDGGLKDVFEQEWAGRSTARLGPQHYHQRRALPGRMY